ncbi:DUF3616 domain-containing protein [Lyngbya sp. PCC 8106]|uniref:DUF3616 domain-containing protein n=1 Tax=Lyngbya sp. (strain PCC 8106) TaxID=313612 RepID=UPI0000EACE46|nr:DUF3616 domain-containing protein [Lyngbya sp. PCC 8106]EAW34752.1 hypothetical protein L8106_26057 [Lyngbya sp. PCC 8106]
MSEGFLLSRVLLRFEDSSDDLVGELSAAAITPDGSLWVGSDELLGVERLSQVEPFVFGNHKHFSLLDFIELPNTEDEIDIEGMDYSHGYLWVMGSHSTKRKKPKGKDPEKDVERLSEVKSEANRYLIARIPVIDGNLIKSCTLKDDPEKKRTAALLETTKEGNILVESLKSDPHIGTIVSTGLPSKDNGLDIEGLAVSKHRIFLGLRGPVLRGLAIILEIEVEETKPGVLTLKPIEKDGQLYRKHFIELDGLGIRELFLHDGDLIILGGPTMDLNGAMRVFRLKNIEKRTEEMIYWQESKHLEVMFDLPIKVGADKAEGIAHFPCLGQSDSVLIVYDSPAPERRPNGNELLADVFRLKSEL